MVAELKNCPSPVLLVQEGGTPMIIHKICIAIYAPKFWPNNINMLPQPKCLKVAKFRHPFSVKTHNLLILLILLVAKSRHLFCPKLLNTLILLTLSVAKFRHLFWLTLSSKLCQWATCCQFQSSFCWEIVLCSYTNSNCPVRLTLYRSGSPSSGYSVQKTRPGAPFFNSLKQAIKITSVSIVCGICNNLPLLSADFVKNCENANSETVKP